MKFDVFTHKNSGNTSEEIMAAGPEIREKFFPHLLPRGPSVSSGEYLYLLFL
jgi:hypothetical protein